MLLPQLSLFNRLTLVPVKNIIGEADEGQARLLVQNRAKGKLKEMQYVQVAVRLLELLFLRCNSG
jgi:hypothetical protein